MATDDEKGGTKVAQYSEAMTQNLARLETLSARLATVMGLSLIHISEPTRPY